MQVLRLNRPSGNVTGFVNYEASLGGKWLELLSEIAPGLKQAAIMFNPHDGPVSILTPSLETAGGLLSYGPDQADIFRRTATYVDRILRGAKAGDLPVQFPTKFEMAVNLKTANALGLSIPPSILAIADEVIE